MSGCNINGSHIIGINEVDGKMNVVTNEILGNHSILELDYLSYISMCIPAVEILGKHAIHKLDYSSDISICIPAVEKVIAVWYVYGETVIGIDDKYYGYVMFK